MDTNYSVYLLINLLLLVRRESSTQVVAPGADFV